MAKASSFSITFDIEPLMKLICEDTACQFNLVDRPGSWLCCALKHVTIGVGGICTARSVAVAAPSNNAVHLTPATAGACATDDTEPQAQVTADR